jgi:carbon storage regulator
MLFLGRRIGESILIGEDITITVVAYREGQVRLGISAPAGVTVHREEVHRRIRAERASREGTPREAKSSLRKKASKPPST